MRKPTTALQPSSQPQPTTKCATCRHLTDLTHDCSVHRCVMSEHDGRVIVHECSGWHGPVQNGQRFVCDRWGKMKDEVVSA